MSQYCDLVWLFFNTICSINVNRMRIVEEENNCVKYITLHLLITIQYILHEKNNCNAIEGSIHVLSHRNALHWTLSVLWVWDEWVSNMNGVTIINSRYTTNGIDNEILLSFKNKACCTGILGKIKGDSGMTLKTWANFNWKFLQDVPWNTFKTI